MQESHVFFCSVCLLLLLLIYGVAPSFGPPDSPAACLHQQQWPHYMWLINFDVIQLGLVKFIGSSEGG